MRKAKKAYIIGVDIGATIVKIGLVKRNGKIISRVSFSTKRSEPSRTFIRKIIEQINSFMKKAKVSKENLIGIGIGAPGTVNYEKGIVHNLTNIKGWKEVPLKKILKKYFNLPIYIDNDANAFACGQLKWGAARDIQNAICVTLGSGIGGGLIIGGEIFRGSNYSAGEIGHICIDADGPRCNCGSKGCMEAFVGNKYVINRVIGKIKRGEKTILTKMAGASLSNITPQMITKAAKKADKFAIAIWKEVGVYLGIGLAGLVNVLNPERIIIGGGVSKAGKFIFNPLKKELHKKAMSQHIKILEVVRTTSVDNAGIVGAASLVMEKG